MIVVRTATALSTQSDLLRMQVARVLSWSQIDAAAVQRILAGIDRRWIETIYVSALDGGGRLVAELTTTVDWARHELAVSSGRDMDAADMDSGESLVTEMDTVLRLFGQLSESEDLTMRVGVRYVMGVDAAVADKILGFTAAERRPTADLPVFNAGIRSVDPAAPPAEAATDAGDGSIEPQAPSAQDVARRFLSELERLIGSHEPDSDVLERAARIVAAEQSWREGLGLLLEDDDVARLLDLDRRRVPEFASGDDVIVLRARDGTARYPAYQFQGGHTTPILARAHRTLVESGYVSPWSAASWARTGHPELGLRSPAQWAGENRDDETLLLVARRDAARAAQ